MADDSPVIEGAGFFLAVVLLFFLDFFL